MCTGAMSEDDRDIDVESADDVPDIGMEATASCQSPSLGLGVSACYLCYQVSLQSGQT